MIKCKITKECCGLPFSFYYEIRGERVWASLRIGDDQNFKEKSKDITKDELSTILKVINDIPYCPLERWIAEVEARKNAYVYRWEVFMPMVDSFFTEDWDKLL